MNTLSVQGLSVQGLSYLHLIINIPPCMGMTQITLLFNDLCVCVYVCMWFYGYRPFRNFCVV